MRRLLAILAVGMALTSVTRARATTVEFEFTTTGAYESGAYTEYYGVDQFGYYWSSPIQSAALDAVPLAGTSASDWFTLTDGATTVSGVFSYEYGEAPYAGDSGWAVYSAEFLNSTTPTVAAFDALIGGSVEYHPPTIVVYDNVTGDAVLVNKHGYLGGHGVSGLELTLDFMEVLDSEIASLPALDHFPIRAVRNSVHGYLQIELFDHTESALTGTSLPASLDLSDFDEYALYYSENELWLLEVDPSDYANPTDYAVAVEWLANHQDYFNRDRYIYFGLDTLTQLSVPVTSGDFNGDGIVDAADYVWWRKNPSVGSYEDWVRDFGTSISGSGATVPEPSTIVLVTACCSVLLISRRRGGKVSG